MKIIITVLITSLIVGGGIFLLKELDAQKRIANFENQISELREENNALKKSLEVPTRENSFLKFISPDRGEALCLGENTAIEWESQGIKSVIISIWHPGDVRKVIGASPAEINEANEPGKGTFVWEVGKVEGETLEEGDGYELEIWSPDWSIRDVSDNAFSIILCKG